MEGITGPLWHPHAHGAGGFPRGCLGYAAGDRRSVRLDDLALLVPAVVIGLVGCLLVAPGLQAIRLGSEVAPGLGVSRAGVEGAGLAIAVLLVSVATSVVGPVGFVAPQLAMRVFRTPGPPPVAGGITGAVVVLGTDLVAQQLPGELPVGVLTAIIGAPFLLFLLTTRLRRTGV